ncbi:unnamed protein product [Vitrella brassicaformis CCMP3155]|uniref:Uncharacterized protein n=1 Tax=Vitrella brassicaformis (strain CCMP3155) TaxID=1169540 RepID=A0A0G4H567_VITBC|nr:unnamed protein product [Vitrella brassicaformis CCMP3155]|eukprot:CEM38926.1 unnamed protein product [Vitrella brassicaformis CCMP3155]
MAVVPEYIDSAVRALGREVYEKGKDLGKALGWKAWETGKSWGKKAVNYTLDQYFQEGLQTGKEKAEKEAQAESEGEAKGWGSKAASWVDYLFGELSIPEWVPGGQESPQKAPPSKFLKALRKRIDNVLESVLEVPTEEETGQKPGDIFAEAIDKPGLRGWGDHSDREAVDRYISTLSEYLEEAAWLDTVYEIEYWAVPDAKFATQRRDLSLQLVDVLAEYGQELADGVISPTSVDSDPPWKKSVRKYFHDSFATLRERFVKWAKNRIETKHKIALEREAFKDLRQHEFATQVIKEGKISAYHVTAAEIGEEAKEETNIRRLNNRLIDIMGEYFEV